MYTITEAVFPKNWLLLRENFLKNEKLKFTVKIFNCNFNRISLSKKKVYKYLEVELFLKKSTVTKSFHWK